MGSNHVVLNELRYQKDDPMLGRVEKIYNASFPEVERRAFSLVLDLLRKDGRFRMYALLNNNEYVGFINSWRFDSFSYVEHFAIDESARNGGIGAKAMSLFLESQDCPVVLEVELPTDDMSKRRIGFYERLGFVLDDHKYFQPPYRVGEGFLEMRIMHNGLLHVEHDFVIVQKTLHKNVYGVK